MSDLNRWAPSLTAFSKWLSSASESTAKLWSRRLNSGQAEQVEGAVAEAVAWDFLACRCSAARLCEVAGSGGVDFEFDSGGRAFFVEVTNISSGAAGDASGMPDTDLFKGFYGLLTKQIRSKVRGKFDQARLQEQHPLLVFVTTLHWNASRACINRTAVEFAMSSPPRITGRFNPESGAIEGDLYQSTDLSQSVFLTPRPVLGADGKPIAQAKYQPISGFLVGGFGLEPREVRVLGALNPEATRPFDPATLEDVPFCSFRDWPTNEQINFDWTITEEEEQVRERAAAERRLRAAGHGELLDGIRDEIARRHL
jgi:hypothetical protein